MYIYVQSCAILVYVQRVSKKMPILHLHNRETQEVFQVKKYENKSMSIRAKNHSTGRYI